MKVFKGATIFTGTGKKIENGILIVEGTQISFVGTENKVEIPSDAEIIELQGKYIFPGLIDPHTHVGIDEEGVGEIGDDYNEMADPVTPYLRAIDGIYPQDQGFEDALSGGITTVGVTPGSANVIGGEIAALHTVGRTVEEKLVRAPVGMKFAMGENPKRVYGKQQKTPYTRMAVAYLIRQALYKAIDYANKWDIYNNKASENAHASATPPDHDLGLENLSKVLDTSIKARFHAHRIDDIMTAIRIGEEFGLNMTIEHATEGHKIADILSKKQIPCVVGPVISTRAKVELKDRSPKTAAILVQHGVPVSIMTDHPVVPIQHLRDSIMIAIKNGLPWEKALYANTLQAAKILGIEDLTGSLEKGKMADFVITDKENIFSIETNILQVYVEGTIALDNM